MISFVKGFFTNKKKHIVINLRPHQDSITTKWIEKNKFHN